MPNTPKWVVVEYGCLECEGSADVCEKVGEYDGSLDQVMAELDKLPGVHALTSCGYKWQPTRAGGAALVTGQSGTTIMRLDT